MPTAEAGISTWLTIVESEYREIPGLSLTKPQVQRLWGLDATLCDALVEALETMKFLKRTPSNRYVRADVSVR